jgi:hypothetical protein
MEEQEREQIIERAVAGETVSALKPERVSEESKTTPYARRCADQPTGAVEQRAAGIVRDVRVQACVWARRRSDAGAAKQAKPGGSMPRRSAREGT